MPLLKHAQYASRLLILVAFAGAAAGGAVALWTKWRGMIAASLIGIALVYGLAYGRTYNTQPIDDSYYRHYWQQWLGAADWGAPIMPRWNRFGELAPTRTFAVAEGNGEVIESQKRSTHISARVRADAPLIVRFSTLYFPGWRAWVDGTETSQIDIKHENGTIGVPVEPGTRTVEIRFIDTPVRRIGNGVTVASFAGMVLLGIGFAWLAIRRGRIGGNESPPSLGV